MRVFARGIGVIVLIMVAIWCVAGVTAIAAMKLTGRNQWPSGLGALASVEQRVLPHPANAAAQRLTALAAPLGITFTSRVPSSGTPTTRAIVNYVRAEHLRSDGTIAAPPALVTAFLVEHAAEIDALRDHLLRHEIRWELNPAKGLAAPEPIYEAHLHVTSLLAARALVRARVNDLRAWDELHAIARLGESLKERPDLISQIAFLTMARSINGVAWKLPATQTAWFSGLQHVDHRYLLLAGSQYEAWMAWRYGEQAREGLHYQIIKPYLRWGTAVLTRAQRRSAQQFAAATTCRFNAAAHSQELMSMVAFWAQFGAWMPDLAAAWERGLRVVPEREATANAIRIALGQPIVAKSACSDGSWTFANGRLSFSTPLEKSEAAMPLSLAIPARATRPAI